MRQQSDMSADEVLRILEQSDVALSVAGLSGDDIFRAEHNRARTAVAALIASNAEQAKRIEALEAERDALLADADRYRFIRSGGRSETGRVEIRLWNGGCVTYGWQLKEHGLDGAIDAARAEARDG